MYSDTEAKLVAENRELRAEVDRLRGVSSMPPDYVKNVIRASRGDRKKMREAIARAEAAEKEALEYIDYRNQAVISRNAMERRLEAAEALVAGLRGALELLLKCNALGVAIPWGRAVAALTITPASAGNRSKAEALRETATELEHLRDHIQEYIGPDDARDDIRRICWNRAKDLRAEADRLAAEEKEAANG